MLGLFAENGPFSINDDLTLKRNNFSWNTAANVMYVDQPIGTGFSLGDPKDMAKTENDVAFDFYSFLFNFFEKYP